MRCYYVEHPEFGEFTYFDTTTGTLTEMTHDAFLQALFPEDALHVHGFNTFNPQEFTLGRAGEGIKRVGLPEGTLFYGETSATHTRFPRRVYCQITRHCHLQCSYCFIKASADQPHAPTDGLIAIASFLSRNGLMEARLTGGEPTTHPDFFGIVDAFRDHHVYVSVATNGMFSPETLDGLAARNNLGLVCSLDGAKDTHNRLRRGTFDTIVANLAALKRENPTIALRLNTVLTKHNVHDIRAIARKGQLLGADSLTMIPLRPQVRVPSARNDMLTAAEFKQAIEDMVRAIQEFGVKITTAIPTDYNQLSKDKIVRNKSSCAAGREATNLDYDARSGVFVVYGCGYSPASTLEALPALRKPFIAGEFSADRASDFLRIWRDEAAWALYRDPKFKGTECRKCLHRERGRCPGSCPIQNVDYSKISVTTDVLEQLKDQLSRTAEWYCYKRLM